MRYIGLILALGTICWVLYQAAGGGEAETVITAGQQKSLEKAQDVEDVLQEASRRSMEEAEQKATENAQ